MDASEKGLIRNLQTHDLAEQLRLRRAKLAKEVMSQPPAVVDRMKKVLGQ